ncbi:hypothetical protein [Mesorhizobium sp. NZP2298]|uniref:hypothetical protein n=1 Tax=Mesorhizobium sp. NZP2298 TaxID=2483403 RepID=UPI001555228B|nr:hypothetical protein [Mesorhizobium sp. NZP2298]QKC99194.1 hypothetical protein EB231_34990 [Mesorhizobium sp. NZP2298]
MNDNTPDERAATRLMLAERAEEQKRAMRRFKVRIGKRQAIGKDWDGKADNDNIAWPLAKALLAEGSGDLLAYAMKYRKIYDTAKAEVALGFKATPPPEMTIVHKNRIDESSGRIIYGGEFVLKSAPTDIPATMKSPTNADSKKNAAPVPKPWNGDMEIINALDARSLLAHLQRRLGLLVEPFEMAVVDCATLAEVGNAAGIANRAGSMGAGRALVHTGLFTVRDALGALTRKDIAA